jgi:hypothetical protein
MSVKIGASWFAADFKLNDGIESGPVALCKQIKSIWKMSALTTKKIPKNSGHLSRARVKNGLELPH